MDEQYLKQLLAEIIESQSAANAIMMLAIAKQLDHTKIREDMLTLLSDWKASEHPMPSSTERLLSQVLEALPAKPMN